MIDFFPGSEPLDALPSLEACDRHLRQRRLPNTQKATWLCIKAQKLIAIQQHLRAITCCNDALHYDGQAVRAIAHRALANEQLGYDEVALIDYELALSVLSPPPTAVPMASAGVAGATESSLERSQRIWLWQRKGSVYRSLKRYRDALMCYDTALQISPEAAEALSGRGVILALMGKRQQGLQACKRAVQLAPDSVNTLNCMGIVLMVLGRHKDALGQFDQSLALQPDYSKAWNNRAIALSRMGHDAAALESLDNALADTSASHESWYAMGWVLKGLTQMKLGKFSSAIESCEKAQSFDPTLYGAALGKLGSLIASGKIIKRFTRATSRHQLCHDVGIVFNAIKFRLAILAAIIGVLVLSNSAIFAGVRSLLPTLLSIGIIGLITTDLWLHKSKLNFVWRIYFQSGALTYIRAIGVLYITLNTFAIAESLAPPFMLWGWASAVFGQPGNLIFQPFNLLNSLHPISRLATHLSSLPTPPATFHVSSMPQALHSPTPFLPPSLPHLLSIPATYHPLAHATFHPTLASAFILCFWLMLLLGIPFWARLEERIFRQGANSWRQIGIRSVQFGLVHLIVGIPILAGFVLIVPGFLFACRYKYVHDKHLKTHQNLLKAQEAGMLASTADHAVYNAILVTVVAATLFLDQSVR